MNVIHLCAAKEKEMNLVITQLFVFTIGGMGGRGRRLRQGGYRFLRTSTKVKTIGMAVVRDLDMTIIKPRS